MLQRLRRACGKTRGGKVQVDTKVHELWAGYACEKAERLALAKTFAACGWNKACRSIIKAIT